jgi:hypothetical protein
VTDDSAPYRRPVGVAPESGSSRLVVVCDDGSVWKWIHAGHHWEEMAPVPGTSRAAHGREGPAAGP